jgi:hypothetical protein
MFYEEGSPGTAPISFALNYAEPGLELTYESYLPNSWYVNASSLFSRALWRGKHPCLAWVNIFFGGL